MIDFNKLFILQVIIKQCIKRNAELQDSVTFFVTNGEMLFISFIDVSSAKDEWKLSNSGKLNVSN